MNVARKWFATVACDNFIYASGGYVNNTMQLANPWKNTMLQEEIGALSVA